MLPQEQHNSNGGLHASKHAHIHPERAKNVGGSEGVQRDGVSHPHTQSQPSGLQKPTNGPRGHKSAYKQRQTQDNQEILDNIEEDITKALEAPQAPPSLTLLSILQKARTAIHTLKRAQNQPSDLQTIQATLQTILDPMDQRG